MGGGSSKQTVGYKYYLGMHMILCHGPIDNISKIYVDDKLAWSGSSTGSNITINSKSLFGGESREGGVSGSVDIEMGGSDQTPNDYLQSKLGVSIPAYKGVVGVVLRQCYLGMNPYLKLWKFRGTRINKLTNGYAQWYSSYAAIGQDLNPIHIIRECLTSTSWGMGYSENDINLTNFESCARTLHSEGMGMSLLWDRQIALEDFISEVVRHINATIYVDKVTGQFTISLIRDDLDPDTLPVLDESNVTKVADFSRSSIGELANTVTVIYWDQSTGNDASVTVQDIALAQAQQSTIAQTIRYPGFTNGTVASAAASRDLQALSTPLCACTIEATREVYDLNIGDGFVLSWPDLGIESVVMRVTGMALGGFRNSKVKITAAQDIFSIGETLIAPPVESGWTNPVSEPTACTLQLMYEAPFWDLVNDVGISDATAMDDDDAAFAIIAVSPTPDTISGHLWTDSGYGYEQRATIDFCPTAQLDGSINKTDTVIAIKNPEDVTTAILGGYIIIGDEMMRLDAVSSTSITVGRGVLDTVPTTHLDSDRIYFAGDYSATDGEIYQTGESVYAKITTITGLGELPILAASTSIITMDQRAQRPYPPGNFKVDGQSYPASVIYSADLVVTWAHRSRIQQTTSYLEDTTFGDIGPEDGVTYTAVLKTGSTVLATHSGLTGTTTTFTVAEMASNTSLTVELYSVRSGFNSWTTHTHTFLGTP